MFPRFFLRHQNIKNLLQPEEFYMTPKETL